ncbi:MAG: DNA recombination protein RmuC [Prevotellaceae bacterium]|jgi:DNA recombination protein RmuC|nr:DNA recombination protein RmuC [Prevotellaceae bacterium]
MMIFLYILLSAMVVFCMALSYLLWKTRQPKPAENTVARPLYDELKTEVQQKNEALMAAKSELAKAQERISILSQEMYRLQETFKLEFRNVANDLLEEKSRKFTELNEKNIGAVLQPLKERITDFEKKVEETYSRETREKTALRKELEQMMKLNQQVSDDANRLTKALKGDSKLQGDWGEVQLELILEKAGLLRDVHYRKQDNFKTEDGANVRPDYIINLPENKHFVIDAKVSLTAYEQFYNTEEETPRARFLSEHLASIQRHITDLGAKNYQLLYGIHPPDYVLLFVPLEAALTAALREDSSLFEKALAKNIALVSPSTLLATLRTISFIWKQENQKRNVLEIAKEGGALYDKFVAFMNDLVNVGKRLQDTKKEYDGAMNKLFESSKKRDTIIGRIEHLRTLGADATKQLPQILLDRAGEE